MSNSETQDPTPKKNILDVLMCSFPYHVDVTKTRDILQLNLLSGGYMILKLACTFLKVHLNSNLSMPL